MFRVTPARRHARLGDEARDARRWAEACVHYERALATDATLDGIWVQLGHARKEVGDLPGAEAAYGRALALKPGVPDTHLQLGHLLKIAGRFDDAVKAYADATLLDPSLNDARAELATLGYSPKGMRVFNATFAGLHGMRRSAGVVRIEVSATLDGIDTIEFLHLMAHKGLHVGYRLHIGCSATPVAHSGHAAVEVVSDAALRCRFALPAEVFYNQSLAVMHVGLFYGETGSVEDGDHPGAWLAVDGNQVDLPSHYLALVAEHTATAPASS